MAEEETCIICGRVRPVSQMRFGTFNEEVGSHVTLSSGTRSGNRHSTSFGGSSGMRIGNSYSSGNRSRRTTRRDYQKVRGWACRYHGLVGRIFRRLLVTAIVLFVGYSWLMTKVGGPHMRGDPLASVQATSAPDTGSRTTEVDRPPSRESDASGSTAEHPHSALSGLLPSSWTGSSIAAEPSPPEQPHVPGTGEARAAALTADPKSDERVADAMAKAATSGEPARWHSHRLHGYAVPSAPDANGCRMVQVSVDETGEKSSPTSICPTQS